MSASSPLATWGRLARLSLLPSALADAVAGLALGGVGAFPQASLVVPTLAASACVYHGGMVLNDWADRAEDARTRPDRPIPSGAVTPQAALVAGIGLLAAAVLLAALANAALWMAGLVALVLAYDFVGRGPWRGPLLLGACRAANLGFGIHVAQRAGSGFGESIDWAPAIVALYFLYVVSASRVARLEDASDDSAVGSTPRTYLSLAALALLAVPWVHVADGPQWPSLAPFALVMLGSIALFNEARRPGPLTRADAGRATGVALRRLIVFTAAVTLCAGGTRSVLDGLFTLSAKSDCTWAALAILSGFPLSAALRKVFPPT
ncbi:MAG: UbiA family prenyltransferase [Planctomycetota bacterium]|nr:UbiA family prenyltransferase [Planctomycetota bacterium]